MEQVGVLGDVADGAVQAGLPQLPHVHPTDLHGPGVDVVEAGQQVGEGGLARPGGTDQGDGLPRLSAETDPADHRCATPLLGGIGFQRRQRHLLPSGVAEPHVVEDDACRGGDVHRVGGVRDGGLEVEDLEDPLEADHRGHQIDPQVRELHQRPVEACQQRDHRGQSAQAQLPRDDGAAAEPVEQGDGQRPDQGQRRQEDARHHGHVHPVAGQLPSLLVKEPRLAALVTKQLHQQRPGDGEPLGHGLGQLGLVLHAQPRQPSHALGH